MRYLLLLFFSLPVYAEYEFEKSKYGEGTICSEMVGVWFFQTTAPLEEENQKLRDL